MPHPITQSHGRGRGFALSEAEAVLFEELLGWWSKNRLSMHSDPGAVEHEEHPAPEVHIARAPATGIPALWHDLGDNTGTGTGTGSGMAPGQDSWDDSWVPGRADCFIYRLVGAPDRGELGPKDKILDLVDGLVKTVFNISTSPIPGDKFVPVYRDKMGDWIVDTFSPSPCDCEVFQLPMVLDVDVVYGHYLAVSHGLFKVSADADCCPVVSLASIGVKTIELCVPCDETGTGTGSGGACHDCDESPQPDLCLTVTNSPWPACNGSFNLPWRGLQTDGFGGPFHLWGGQPGDRATYTATTTSPCTGTLTFDGCIPRLPPEAGSGFISDPCSFPLSGELTTTSAFEFAGDFTLTAGACPEDTGTGTGGGGCAGDEVPFAPNCGGGEDCCLKTSLNVAVQGTGDFVNLTGNYVLSYDGGYEWSWTGTPSGFGCEIELVFGCTAGNMIFRVSKPAGGAIIQGFTVLRDSCPPPVLIGSSDLIGNFKCDETAATGGISVTITN